jgi:hypothetical protein
MSKRLWLKGALMLMTTGVTLGLGYAGGCLEAVVQRILVGTLFT